MLDLTDPIYSNEAAARAHLEEIRWVKGAYCPHCGDLTNIKKLGGAAAEKGLWHCGSCRKKFTVTVGTVFERSHIPLTKGLAAFHLLCSSKKGISAHQGHRMLDVTYKTAWFMWRRIREAMKRGGLDAVPPMGGASASPSSLAVRASSLAWTMRLAKRPACALPQSWGYADPSSSSCRYSPSPPKGRSYRRSHLDGMLSQWPLLGR